MRSWGRYVILGSLCPSFRAKGAPLQGDPWPFLPGPISRPPYVNLPPHKKKRTENNTDFWTAFGSPNAPKSLPKWPSKPLKNHRKFDTRLDQVFNPIFYRILLVFAAVRPTIWLLFTVRSWGASFFAKLGKYQKNTPEKLPKLYQNRCKIASKIYQKTKSKNRAKKH